MKSEQHPSMAGGVGSKNPAVSRRSALGALGAASALALASGCASRSRATTHESPLSAEVTMTPAPPALRLYADSDFDARLRSVSSRHVFTSSSPLGLLEYPLFVALCLGEYEKSSNIDALDIAVQSADLYNRFSRLDDAGRRVYSRIVTNSEAPLDARIANAIARAEGRALSAMTYLHHVLGDEYYAAIIRETLAAYTVDPGTSGVGVTALKQANSSRVRVFSPRGEGTWLSSHLEALAGLCDAYWLDQDPDVERLIAEGCSALEMEKDHPGSVFAASTDTAQHEFSDAELALTSDLAAYHARLATFIASSAGRPGIAELAGTLSPVQGGAS